MLLLSNSALAETLYVREDATHGGDNSGLSYANAWQGLGEVVWGTGAGEVGPGDTLYVCGLHLSTYTGAALVTFTPSLDGTSGNRITIRGDHSVEPGIIWGAGIMAHEAWNYEGSNTWSITDVGTPNLIWYFEDITADSWTVLQSTSSIAECKATPGSFYGTGIVKEKFYVHCSDNAAPTNRIAANRIGYQVHVNDRDYITFQNLECYCIYRWISLDNSNPVTNITWNGCTVWYGDSNFVFEFKNNKDYMSLIDCDIAYCKNGVGLYEYPAGGMGASYCLIQGCTIHNCTGDSDAHGIGLSGSNNTIERNNIYNCGSGVTMYLTTAMTAGQTSNVIRWNYIHDTHTNYSANGRGIEFNQDGDNTADKSGNQCYGNIVSNIDDHGYRCTWPSDQVVFYNNLAYKCDTSFYFHHTEQASGPNIIFKNNVSISPVTRHVYFYTDTGDGNFGINADYNSYYPVSGDDFYFNADTAITYAEWTALSATGCTFDDNSSTADPDLVDESVDNFFPNSGSPLINTGTDVGLTEDKHGVSIPQGSGVDKGPYEYATGYWGIM